jgi:hypothetical protein
MHTKQQEAITGKIWQPKHANTWLIFLCSRTERYSRIPYF